MQLSLEMDLRRSHTGFDCDSVAEWFSNTIITAHPQSATRCCLFSG